MLLNRRAAMPIASLWTLLGHAAVTTSTTPGVWRPCSGCKVNVERRIFIMARLGILKPLHGTSSSLSNIVLEEGEIAFDYLPGGTYGDYGIKMGDGSTVYSNLPYFIKRSKGWTYDEGTDEAALINNLEHPELETIGKIYYIQSYMNAGTIHTEGAPTIQQDVPYKVIGVNHDGMSNSVDLMSCVAVNYLMFNNNYNSWYYGRYTTSKIYNWLPNTCAKGYSANIQAKMIPMIERWREATGNATGTLQTRSTKCKLLNPVELFGTSAANYYQDWEYANTSDYKTKFTTEDYGTQYSIWSNSTGSLTSRIIFHNKDMSTASIYCTNSWLAFRSSNSLAWCFGVYMDGSCYHNYVNVARGVAPVLRLSSDWQYDEGTDEVALLNNLKHPELEQIGKIYYIQSYMNAGTEQTEGTPTIQQNIPYKVIGINHEGTTNTVDLMSCVAVNYLKFNNNDSGWSYGKYTSSKLYNWLPNTCAKGYSANIQAKMVSMTERWREATGNTSGTLQARYTKCKILNPFELFGSSSTTYSAYWGVSVPDFTQYNYGEHYSGVFPNSISADNSRIVYHDTAMSNSTYYWTNSWFTIYPATNGAFCFNVFVDGQCSYGYARDICGIAPVIRLSDNPS
jgi:hypothetical protein